MAKIDALPGIEVDIISNGVILPEYPDDDYSEVVPRLADRTVSRYIESESEQEFTFQFTVKPPYKHDCDYVGFYITIDGENLNDGQLCGPGHLDDDDSWVDTVSGIERDMASKQGRRLHQHIFTKFKFNKIATTSERGSVSPSTSDEMIRYLGLLEITVFRMKDKPLIPKPIHKKRKDKRAVVSEKALKGRAISRNILLEDEHREVSQGDEWQRPNFMDGVDYPIAAFRFKCRSRDDLQKELIIPRTPIPSPRPESPPQFPNFKDLPDEEKLEYARTRYGREVGRQEARALLLSRIGRKTEAICDFHELTDEAREELGKEEYEEITKPLLPSPLQTNHEIKPEKRSRDDFEADLDSPALSTSSASLRKKLVHSKPRPVTGKNKAVIDLMSDGEDTPSSKPASQSKSRRNSSSRLPQNRGPSMSSLEAQWDQLLSKSKDTTGNKRKP